MPRVGDRRPAGAYAGCPWSFSNSLASPMAATPATPATFDNGAGTIGCRRADGLDADDRLGNGVGPQ